MYSLDIVVPLAAAGKQPRSVHSSRFHSSPRTVLPTTHACARMCSSVSNNASRRTPESHCRPLSVSIRLTFKRLCTASSGCLAPKVSLYHVDMSCLCIFQDEFELEQPHAPSLFQWPLHIASPQPRSVTQVLYLRFSYPLRHVSFVATWVTFAPEDCRKAAEVESKANFESKSGLFSKQGTHACVVVRPRAR